MKDNIGFDHRNIPEQNRGESVFPKDSWREVFIGKCTREEIPQSSEHRAQMCPQLAASSQRLPRPAVQMSSIQTKEKGGCANQSATGDLIRGRTHRPHRCELGLQSWFRGGYPLIYSQRGHAVSLPLLLPPKHLVASRGNAISQEHDHWWSFV